MESYTTALALFDTHIALKMGLKKQRLIIRFRSAKTIRALEIRVIKLKHRIEDGCMCFAHDYCACVQG